MKSKKAIKWLLGALAALILLLGIGVYWVQHSQSFHQWALRKMIEKTESATGARIEIRDFAIHWKALHVDLDRIVVHGSEEPRQIPLFAADRVEVGLKIISIFRRKVDLSELILTHPVFHLIEAHDGGTNLPHRQSTGGSGTVNLFNLAIRHVSIVSGECYYNDEKIPLNGELHDLQTAIDFETLKQAYRGTLSYDRGRFAIKEYEPFEHAAKLQFEASPSQFSANPLDLTLSHSHLLLHATLKDYSNPQIDGNYQAEVETADVRGILKQNTIPTAKVSATGAIRYQNQPDRSFLDALYVDGQFHAPNVPARVSPYGGDVRNVRGRFRVQDGDLVAQNVEGEIYDGRLNASFVMRHLATSQDAQLTASVQRMSLQSVALASGEAKLKQLPLAGRVDAKAQLSWRGSADDLHLTSDATITSANPNGSATNASLQTGGAVPVDGTLHLAYDRDRSLLSISHSYLKTSHTTLNLDGTVSSQSSLSVQANVTDLQEADLLVLAVKSALAPPQKSQASPPFSDIRGAANLNVRVTGSLQNPKISGSLSATNLQTGSIRLRTVRTNLEASSSQVALHDGEIAEANTGRVTFDATVGLNHWAFSQASPVTAQVTADRMPVADLQEIANLHYPVAGNLSAKISASGSVLNPGGQGSLQLTQATVYNQAVQNLTVQFQGTGASIHSTANLRVPAGTVTADVTYAQKAKSYEVKLDTSGLKLDQLPALQTRGQITGTLVASVNGRGTLAQPQLTLSASVNPLQVRDQVIQRLQAHADLAGRQVNFTLQSEIAHNTVQATGGVNLSGAYDADVTLDTKPFPIGEFLAMYVPGAPDQLQGQTEIHATLRGPLKDPARFEAHVSLPNLSIAYGPLQFASAQPIRVDFQNDVVTLAPAEFKGNGTDLRIQGSVPVKGTGQLNASAHGTVEMDLLKFVQKNADSSGQITLDVEARGDRAHPSVQGKIQFANASYSTPTIPLGFEKVNGSINLQGNRLQLTELTAQAGGGTINASGFAILGSAMTINLTADAENVRVRYPRGVRAVLDGRLTWTGTSAASAVGGTVTIRRLSFTKEFDLSSFVTQFTGEAVPSNSSAFEQNMRLNIGIQSSNELQLASNQLSLQGAANLRLTGTLANPIVLGRATLSGGNVYFLGNRYDIQNGVINFANPVRTEPVLNLYVTTNVDQYNITMNFIGPIDELRTSYASTPALPPADIINLLAFGKTMEEQATSPSVPTSLGAESVLAQGVGSVVSSRVQNFAGLSQFSISPAFGGDQTDPGARIALQQHITGNLIFSFSTDLTDTQQEVIGLEYRTQKKVGFSVVRDEYGGYALTIRFHKDY
ncbi:MAG TPA: translocation/assembly module TamB domain-containing protein [Candidatus Acidoferrales bacterium]|nr:translocation/assembly module TamB domain-containing protein [Candidatus Acidoferrales bacterium]